MYGDKYVVILELPNSGFMQCVAICNTVEEAYGKAYLAIADGLSENSNYCISLPQMREGECGHMIEAVSKKDGTIDQIATVLLYRPDDLRGE